jgi:prevent-host-death family protein
VAAEQPSQLPDLTGLVNSAQILDVTETYSTYEAKAKLSEILRKVERGRTVRISRRGQPIAEIRPVRDEPTSLEDRIAELRRLGVVTTPTVDRRPLRPIERRRGALRRFLADRNG